MSATTGSRSTLLTASKPPRRQLQMVWPKARLAEEFVWSLPEGYILRQRRVEDTAEYIRVMASAGFTGWTLERVAAEGRPIIPNGCYVVEHKATRRLAAVAQGNHRPSDLWPCGGELGWLAGDPEHKGKGLGNIVCSAVVRRLLEAGYQNIYLLTDDHRLAAIKIYLRMGFQPLLHAEDMEERWRAVAAQLEFDYEDFGAVRVPFLPAPLPGGLRPETAGLALDAIHGKATKGIASWLIHPMEHSVIERLAGYPPGSYVAAPDIVYLAMQRKIGTCFIDQWIPRNPLSMGAKGYEGAARGATTGAHEVAMDGMPIRSPEDVVEHMEKVVFPKLRKAIGEFDGEARTKAIIENEAAVQAVLAPDILKTGYAFIRFPGFSYGGYGYGNYFMAYALYPEVMEKHFALQADLAVLNNRAAARAYVEAKLPPLYRLDHDMADSRGTLVDIKSLDRIWFPHFARSIEPVVKAGVKLIWHCDGNLMEMVPRLLAAGVRGFQGFQYEDGMDYERICKMKTRDGDDLFIVAGVSVTRTLPHGKPEDVRKEMKWLVENGPKRGLTLGGSSSMAPGVPWENVQAFVEGLQYYRVNGRGG